jgi:predicted NAD-dependent protein-ADP-ribosyltransferase YbiA (DUF1768 family)
MGCKYILNNKEYTEKELLNLASTAASLMSVRTRTNDEMIEIMKTQASNRFVNLDLFTPYQENNYISAISADVISQVGTFKPGEKVKISPSEAFLKTKARFENSLKVYNYLAEKLDTPAKLSEARKTKEYIKKFPQLLLTPSIDDLLLMKNTYANILDNFEGFKAKVKVNLRKFGLKIEEGSNKFQELKLDEEYYRNIVNEDASAEEITEDERLINESYEDGSAFRVNPRDTASTRVKLFFASVPSGRVGPLGLKEFVTYDDVIENFLEIGSELESISYDALQAELLQRSKTRPYLKNVATMLAGLQKDNNTQLLNEILTFTNKSFQEQILVKWDTAGTAGVNVEIIKSNRNTVIRQIYNDWLEQQKTSDIITNKNGELVVDTEKAAELKKTLDEAVAGSVEQKKAWVKSFMASIGITYTDDMINYLEEAANNGEFKKNNLNSNFAQLFLSNNLFSILVNKYNTPPTGKAEVGYDDANNALKDEFTSFNKLADIYYRHTPGRYHTGSSRNGENKSIYSYIAPSYLERIKKKLNYSKTFLDTVLKRSFAKNSKILQSYAASKKSGANNVTLDIFYADSLKKDKKNRDGVVRKKQSVKEQMFEAIIKHQNAGRKTGYYNIFTLSDKTVTPVIHIDKYKLNDKDQRRSGKDLIFKQSANLRDSFDFGNTFKDELYNLVEAEINRIVDYSRQLQAGNKLKQANFDKAFELFYLFPILNQGSRDNGQRIEEIRNRMYEGKTPSKQDVDFIKGIVTENFKDKTLKLVKTMTKSGLISYTKSPSTGELLFNFPFFDSSYMRQPELNGLSDFQKAVYAAADFEFNYLRTQTTALQILGADPALYYKEPSSLKNANLADLTLAQKTALVKSTMDEFSKRAAMFIAPGSQGVWKWYDSKGNMVDRSSYKAITISDVQKNTELFKGVETTDAQEFITLQEHIDRMMSEGRIPLDVWQSITDRLGKKNQIENFQLTPREKSVILQPAKPVHTNSVENGNGFNRIDYVKSSTYPLIPDITRGTQLDDLRVFMESNNIRSANFKTAKKVGQPEKILTVFDENENFIQPSNSDLAGAVQTLSREGLHTQQEIPLQKDEISNISQANRVLFDGLLDVKDFVLENTIFNGQQLKNLKEDIRINLFDKAKNDLSRRFGIQEVGKGVVFKNKKALEQLLREEAIERNFSINDIAAIKVDKDGDLIIPPYLMARGEKFEGLINSLVSKIVRLKNPGTSLVQVSGVASKLKLSDLNKDTKSDVIWLPNYDATKGLQYMRRTKDGVKPAQVLVSQFIRDEEGNLIDLSKFVKEDKKTGIKTLDTSSFSEELFQLVASRIPNQGHPSMLPIEVVGFLPSYMENTIVVPDGITKQMGSDFDVDKLFAYTSSLRLRYSKETENKVIALEKEMLNIKNKSEAENTELYKNYLSKQELATIKQLKEDKNDIVSKLKWNISDKEKARKQKSVDAINTLIESVYENIREKYADEYLKIRQVQEKNKQATRKELDTIRTQIAEAKAGGIVGADKVKYDISKYDVEVGWESISSFNEDELQQMYRDLHWSVLTHRSAFDKITKSIDFGDIKEEADMLEAMGLFKTDITYTPMGFEEQMQIFNDNKSGKVGVSIFASLGSFLADNQDKDIVLGHIDPKTKAIVLDPVVVLDENGEKLELSSISKPGSVGDTKEGTRTKGDNNSMALSESVDNSKNKNLYKFNWAEETMGALSALIALSDQKGNILRINFATRFFKQPIIEEFISEIQSARDTLSDFIPDVKDAVISKVASKYYNMMSEEAQKKMVEDKIEGKYEEEVFGAEKLKQMLQESLGEPADMDSYAKKQLDALMLFDRLSNIGSELSGVIGASYIYTKGVGSSVFDVIDGIRKLGRLSTQGVFVGLENLAGKVEKDVNTGRYSIAEPVGEIGHSIDRSLLFAEKLYTELYPIHFSAFYNKVSEKIFNGLGVDKNNVGSSRFIKLNKEIIKGVRSYLFTNPTLNISDNAFAERQRLLVDDADNKSLATRIMEAKAKFSELEDNYFIKNLGFKLSTKLGLPSQVYYKSPFGDIDEIENNKGFLSLIFSGNDEQIQIAKDLALYTYLTGANQTNSSFGKFIPIEYFISDTDFLSGIKGFKKDVFDNGLPQFYRQFIQNNPDMATRLDKETAVALAKLGNVEKFAIDTTNDLHYKLLVKTGPQDNMLAKEKFADYISYTDGQSKITYLYERTSAPNVGRYERINTLGTRKAGFSEYMMNVKDVTSLLPINMTATQLAEYKALYPDPVTEDNVDIDSLADGMLEDDINLDNLLDQADMFDNIDLDVMAAQEPVTNSSNQVNIYAGTGDNVELSNFANRPFTYNEQRFSSVEQAFQYAKGDFYNVFEIDPSSTENPNDLQIKVNAHLKNILNSKTGAEAKALGGKNIGVSFEKDFWDTESSGIMKELMKASFEQNPEALRLLLATGNSELTHKNKAGVEQDGGRFSRLLMEVRNEFASASDRTAFQERIPQAPKQASSPSEYTNHSGGAIGADSAWDTIGREFGVVNHNHYYYGSKTPKGNIELTKDELDEGVAEMRKAAAVLGKNPQKASTVNLLARNWFQVKNSDQVVAIAPIADNMKFVEGGTGWAVAMAQANNKETHVFNLNDNSWYTWDGTEFVASEVPTLSKNFAGIGSRQDNGKMTEESLQAIYDVYDRTFNSVATEASASDISEQLDITEEIVITDPTDSLNLDDLLGMDMGDTTEVNMEELENQPVDFGANVQTDPVVEELIPNMDGDNSIKTVLNNVFKTTTNPFFKDLIKILGQSGNIKDANVIIDNTMAHPGTYAPGVIRINTDLAKKDNPKQTAKANLETVIMHEVMHAATADILKRFRENKSSLNKRQIIFATGLTNMFKDLQEKMIDSDVHGPKLTEVIDKLFGNNQDVDLSPKEKSMYYGLTNLDEFVSMIMTDRTFQQFMNETMYNENTNTSILDRFKEMLRDLLASLAKMVGVSIDKKSALYNGVDTITKLISEPDIQDHSDNESINGDPNEGPLNMDDITTTQDNTTQDFYMLKTPNGSFKANEDQIAAIDAVSEFLNKPATEKLDDNVFLLHGPGGTGKTASVASAINKARNNSAEQIRVAYTAISHTAKGELVRAGNKEAATLASFLGSKLKITPSGEETFELIPLSEYTDGEKSKPYPGIFTSDWLVIDEASMIGDREMNAIRQRLEERKGQFGDSKLKILFMGDYSQIPPIGLRPDEDGYAINLMKDDSKSIGLSKIERTKNQDITDLGFRFRRAVDYYNQQLDKGIPSVMTGLKVDKMLDKSVTTSSENVSFTSNFKNFFKDYVNVLKQDPFNSQNAVMISYNNEKHPNTIGLNDILRNSLFGEKSKEGLFIAGEPIFLGTTISAPSAETGKAIELPKNSRLVIKSFKSLVKTFNIGSKIRPEYIKLPVYSIVAHYGNDVVNFDAFDKSYTQQLIPSRYDSIRKGYILNDGSFLSYNKYIRLKDAGLTDIFHGYLMSAHKVQGQTYNHSFVHDKNIAMHVRPSMTGEMILTPKSYAQILYTAISRARNKVYVLTDNVADEAGAFVQPTFENPMKSVATEVTAAEFPNELQLENQCKL